MKMNPFKKTTSGISLLELMLATGIMSLMMLGMYGVLNDNALRAVNRQSAEDVFRTQKAAEAYVNINFNSVCYTAGVINSGFNQIDLATIRASGFLPTSSSDLTAQRQAMKVFVECEAGNLTAVPPIPDKARILTLTDNPTADTIRRVEETQLRDATLSIGPKMGTYITANGAGIIESVTRSWQVDATRLPLTYTGTPTEDDGGYMAAYGIVVYGSSLNENFMYKTRIAGRPDLNSMQTDLYMGTSPATGNTITNISNITASSIDNTGQTNITAAVAGETALTVDDYLSVSGASASFRDLNVSGGETAINSIVRSNVANANVVTATINKNTEVTGNILLTNSGKNASAQFETLSARDVNINSKLTTNTLTATGGGIRASNELQTSSLTTSQPVTAQAALVAVANNTTVNNVNNLSIQADSAGNAGLSLNNLNAGTTNATNKTFLQNITCTNGGVPPQCLN